MKIFCDYCKCRFETDENDCCPNCRAPYSDNSEFIKANEQAIRIKQLSVKEKELNLKEMNLNSASSQVDKKTVSQIVLITSIMILVMVSIIAAIFASNTSKSTDENRSKIPVITQKQEKDTAVSAGFNEAAQTVNYSVICDSFEKIERYPFTPEDGFIYVSFHFIVKNTSVGKLNPPSGFYCSVNGEKCSKVWDDERKEPSMGTLPAGVSTSGYVCFEVPADAEYFDISYGDYVSLHIENTLL